MRAQRTLRVPRRATGVKDRRLVIAVEIDRRPLAIRQAGPARRMADDILQRGRAGDRFGRAGNDQMLQRGHGVQMLAQALVTLDIDNQQLRP